MRAPMWDHCPYHCLLPSTSCQLIGRCSYPHFEAAEAADAAAAAVAVAAAAAAVESAAEVMAAVKPAVGAAGVGWDASRRHYPQPHGCYRVVIDDHVHGCRQH
eukprot:COSAG05_NODE_1478_length_4772_cov_14.903921_4_plen_103_part_00